MRGSRTACIITSPDHSIDHASDEEFCFEWIENRPESMKEIQERLYDEEEDADMRIYLVGYGFL